MELHASYCNGMQAKRFKRFKYSSVMSISVIPLELQVS